MTLMRRNPWTLFDEFNRMFPALTDDESRVVGSHWSPAVDIKEEDERFVIRADIPGVAPEDRLPPHRTRTRYLHAAFHTAEER